MQNTGCHIRPKFISRNGDTYFCWQVIREKVIKMDTMSYFRVTGGYLKDFFIWTGKYKYWISTLDYVNVKKIFVRSTPSLTSLPYFWLKQKCGSNPLNSAVEFSCEFNEDWSGKINLWIQIYKYIYIYLYIHFCFRRRVCTN